MKRWAAVVLLAAMTMPSPAGAGEVAHSLEDLGRRLEPGQKVQILERSGRLSEGMVTELTGSSLTLLAAEARAIAADDILRVDQEGDSVRNGILIGAGSGAALGLLTALAYASLSEEEKSITCPECGSPSTMVGTYVVLGAGLGWLIDGLKKGRTRLYQAPLARTSRATVTVAPVVGKGRRGLTVAVGF
jgi:hypothetical protein